MTVSERSPPSTGVRVFLFFRRRDASRFILNLSAREPHHGIIMIRQSYLRTALLCCADLIIESQVRKQRQHGLVT